MSCQLSKLISICVKAYSSFTCAFSYILSYNLACMLSNLCIYVYVISFICMSYIMFISLIQMHLYLHIESVFATLPHTQRATAVVLNGDPKGKNFLYTNGKTVVIRDINVSVRAKSSFHPMSMNLSLFQFLRLQYM